VTSEDTSWIGSRFARLSTGLKMLLILSLGLFPLGLLAIVASVQSARENRADQNDEIRAQAEIIAQRLNSALDRSALTIRAASAAVGSVAGDSPVCEATLQRLVRAQPGGGSYALYGPDGRLRCATAGFAAPARLVGHENLPWQVGLTPDGSALRFGLFDERGNAEGLGEYSTSAIAAIATVPGVKRDFNLELRDGDRVMTLRQGYQGGALASPVRVTEPIADNKLQLRMTAPAVPVTPVELLMILLPVMMWLAAAIIGWLIVDRLLLRPLVRMQKVVSAYRPGDSGLDIPTLSTPAREIGELGQAFDQVTRTVARHEADLEAAVERQTRLVREVHHRVKNNLQVVASLLNIHSRGSRSADVSAAYASIQRRVDALAVVHRNHYAELEENRGVALKPLVSELAANLRATAPPKAANMSISLNVEAVYVSQDVAVSLAFLITEIVEFAMFCDAASVSISVVGGETGFAELSVESESLLADHDCDVALFERFDRIVTGLSRQLRSSIDRDGKDGRYSIPFAVIQKGD
jgi:two-component system, sensor histidine kinase PdtaS